VMTKAINGWVWGNIVCCWLIGFVVDFASGSAYKLEPAMVNISMVKNVALDGEETIDVRLTLLDDKRKVIGVIDRTLVPIENR